MKKKILSVMLCCCMILGLLSYIGPVTKVEAATTISTFLHVDGTEIVEEDGTPVQIKSIGFGNNVWASPASPTLTHHDESSYEELAALGFNSVRFYLNYKWFEDDANPYTYKESGFEWLDKNIEWAKAHGIRLLLNMHVPQGGFMSAKSCNFWNDDNADRHKALWVEIAERYANESAVLGYGLMNEPFVPQAASEEESLDIYYDYMDELITAVRAVDDKHILFIERPYGIWKSYDNVNYVWGATDSCRTINDDNFAWEFHLYEETAFTSQGLSYYSGERKWVYGDDSIAILSGQRTYPKTLSTVVPYDYATGGWQLLESPLYEIEDEVQANNAHFLFYFSALNAETSVYIDDVVVREYDSEGNFIRDINWCDFMNTTACSGWDLGEGTGGKVTYDTTEGYDELGCIKVSEAGGNYRFYRNDIVFKNFPINTDNKYQVICYAKVDGDAEVEIKPSIQLVNAERVFALNKEYLTFKVDTYLDFGETNNVPVYFGEFGAASRSIGGEYKGEEWVKDVFDIFNENGTHYSYHDYHEENWGLYTVAATQARSNRNETLYQIFEDKVGDSIVSETNASFICVRDGKLYDPATQTNFQMIGINMDNNCWDATITPGNRCMDQTSYAEIKAMGFNTVRFCLAYSMTEEDNFYDWLDENIQWAEDAGLKIILDMHAPKGGIQLRNKEAATEFWSDVTVQQDYTRLWVEIAEHYKNNSCVIMYDLLNEPVVVADNTEEAEEKYVTYMNTLISAIRAVDTNHVICVEGYSAQAHDATLNEFSYVQTTLEEWQNDIEDDNVVFDSHTYGPTSFTMQAENADLMYEDVFKISNKANSVGPAQLRLGIEKAEEWTPIVATLTMPSKETSSANVGTLRYGVEHAPANTTIYVDNIVIEEYDEHSNLIGTVFECYFDKSPYKFSSYGNGAWRIDPFSYDEKGGSLCLYSTEDDVEYTVIGEDSCNFTYFKIRPGYTYKVKFEAYSNIILQPNQFRIQLCAFEAEFAGNLTDYALYQANKYASRATNTGRVQICNEFGINYPAMQNGGDKYLSDMVNAFLDEGIGFCLFAYTGADFGLMYDSNRNFGTDQCLLRQDNYDATYNAINAGATYSHVFKNNQTMCVYDDLSVGEKVLVLGEEYAGVGPKSEYTIVSTEDGDCITLGNGLFAMRIVGNSEGSMQINVTMYGTQINVIVPLNVNCVINPNVEDSFTHGDLAITNNSMAPVRVKLLSFTKVDNDKTFITPDGLSSIGEGLTWDELTNEQSKKYFAVGARPLVASNSNWLQTLTNEFSYAENMTTSVPLGTINGRDKGLMELTACHGRSFKEADDFSLKMVFVAELE